MREPYIGYIMTRHKPRARKESDRVDSTPVRAHLEYLLSVGMTSSMIARGAGVSKRFVDKTIGGVTKTTLRPYAAAILTLTPRPNKHQALVMGYPTRRRLEALAVRGWSFPAIATESGISPEYLRYIRTGERVSWNLHCTVADVYDRLHLRDGGNTRAKNWAAREGFAHPFDWDDIEDFHESPTAPEQLDSNQYRAEEVSFFRDLGLSESDVAARLGLTLYGLQQWERRNGEVAA